MAQKPRQVGQLLINSLIPERYRDYNRDYSNPKVLPALLERMARELHPNEYRDILRDIFKLGAHISYYEGASFSLEDFKTPPKTKASMDALRAQVQELSEGSDPNRKEKVIKLVSDKLPGLQKQLLDETVSLGSGLAKQVMSHSRGKTGDLQSILIGDLLMEDSEGTVLPFPLLHSYSEGITPAEYWVGNYGTRMGLLSTKLSTQDAGYASKRAKQVLHDQVVTEDDCGTTRMIEVDTRDPDNVGVVLAADSGDYKAGTVLTPSILKSLKDSTLQVRSPVTCDARRGLCAKCLGIRETGKFADIGDNVGMPAAQSISEKMTQQALCLHKGTLVRMADLTVKPIEDIVVGDMVIGSTRDGVLSPVKVLNTFDQGHQEVHRYSYKKWQSKELVYLECTENHIILANTRKSMCKGSVFNNVVQPLRAGDPASTYFVVLQQDEHEPTNAVTAPLALAMGSYVAEASYSRHLPFFRAKRVQDDLLGRLPCYDIEVDHPDHLFLLANGMTVSNSKKHSAGRSSGKTSPYISGFKLYDQIINAPSKFVDAAAVAPVDGLVTRIEKAPQGGHYIYVENERVHTAANMPPTVKLGDSLEAGDIISDGIPNPAELVKHKGLGEGRRLFMQQMRDLTGSHRRNTEILGKGFIDFVKITDPGLAPNSSPDDIVRYSELVRDWKPREGYRTLSPGGALNKYLETPVAQYTIGTRVTRKVADDLKRKKITKIDVHQDAPPFEPTMVPSVRVLSRASDWQSRMGGYHIKESLLDAAARGMDSSFRGTSYIPALMKGTGFGEELTETGNY